MFKQYSEYKDSEVEWIGKIPSGWHSKKLKYIARVNIASLPETTDGSYEFNYVDISNVDIEKGLNWGDKIRFDAAPSRARRIVKKGNTIISTVRTYLKAVAYIDDVKDVIVSTGFAVIDPQQNLNSKFVYYVLRSEYFIARVCSLSVGVSYPAINPSELSGIALSYPEKEEQAKIAKHLDLETKRIDFLINKKNQMIQLLQEERAAIINQAVTKGLDPNVEMKDSGIEWLGEIPKHWRIEKIQYLGRFQNGISESAEYFGSGYPFISYGDVYSNVVIPAHVEGMAQSSDEERRRMSVEESDVLFTRTSETIDEIGFSAVCMQTIKDAVFSGFLIRFRPTTKALIKEFSKYYFRSEITRKYLISEMNIVTRASLAQDLLKKLPVLLPPGAEQKTVCEYLDKKCEQIDRRMASEKITIALLNEYRTALISEAVTGKIDVRK